MTLPLHDDLPERAFGPCAYCESSLLCAVDCWLAPWNQDRPIPKRKWLYLLRLRRWAGRPVGYGKLGVGIAWHPRHNGRWWPR